LPSRKERKTQIMMAGAAVMTRPVKAMPSITAAEASPCIVHCSRTREIRKTSWSIERPKTTAKMITGIHGSTGASCTPSTPARKPFWKTRTVARSAPPMLSRFIAAA
jgi:hypothetical protein